MSAHVFSPRFPKATICLFAATLLASVGASRVEQSRAEARQEVIFVDAAVVDAKSLVDALPPGAEIVLLRPGCDGLEQMAEVLGSRRNLDAIHVISHGAPGAIQFGDASLGLCDLPARKESLKTIGAALAPDGDLLLYGCRIATGALGEAFLRQLAAETGADVAASINDTGAAFLEGDWTLESTTGPVETASLAGRSHLARYARLLGSRISS